LTGYVARMGEKCSLYYNILVGGPEGIRPLARPRKRREAHIIMDMK
jgi:hypothetical protein